MRLMSGLVFMTRMKSARGMVLMVQSETRNNPCNQWSSNEDGPDSWYRKDVGPEQ